MITRALAAAAVTACALLPGTASGEPYAGQYRYLDTGRLSIQGADGARWVLRVVATRDGTAQSRTEQHLYVDLDRCVGTDCSEVGRWVRPLTPSEVTVEGQLSYPLVTVGPPSEAAGALTTRLAGQVLEVRLTGEGGGGAGAFHGVGLTADPLGIRPRLTQWREATGVLRLTGAGCTVSVERGRLGEEELVDSVGRDARNPRSAPPARLPAGLFGGSRTGRC